MSLRPSTVPPPPACSGLMYTGVPTARPVLGQPLVGRGRDGAGDAEVGHHRASPAEQDVLRLHVAVHDALARGRGQRAGHVARDAQRIGHRQLSVALEPLPQGPALHVRHDVVEDAARPRRSRRAGGCWGAAGGPRAGSRAGSARRPPADEIGPEHLDGDRAVVLEVVGQVDVGRRTPPDLALEQVSPGHARRSTSSVASASRSWSFNGTWPIVSGRAGGRKGSGQGGPALQDVPPQVVVAHDLGEPLPHAVRVEEDAASRGARAARRARPPAASSSPCAAGGRRCSPCGRWP